MAECKNTQQVNPCEKCKADAIRISRGCTDCVDIEFKEIYGSTRGPWKQGLRIGMLNAHSMLGKMDLITGLIHRHQFDIFVVVETWLKDQDREKVKIHGYDEILYNRPKPKPKSKPQPQPQPESGSESESEPEPKKKEKQAGGIIIYYRSWFKRERFHRNIYEATRIQCVCFDFTHPWKFHLFAIYVPKENKQNNKKALEYMKTAYEDRGKGNKIVMLGDLNVVPIKEIEDLGAKQIIKHPTHCTSNNSTSIDHIYTNIQIEEERGGRGGGRASSSRIVEFGVIRSAISDHDVVFCTVKLPEDVTLRSKSFAPDKDIINLFDGTSRDVSITEFMDRIHKKTKNMGPIHRSYSTTAAPSDIMAEGIRELEKRKIEAMKSRTYELKWTDISTAKQPYQPQKASKKNIIEDFAECSEFLTSSSILSWSRNTGEEVTQEEVKTAIEWVIRYRANKVGRFHEVEELVKEWTSGPVLNALIKGYKIFLGLISTTQSECSQSPITFTFTINSISTESTKESTDTEEEKSGTEKSSDEKDEESGTEYEWEEETSTESPTEEEDEEESSVESIIYGVFDYLIAARTKCEVDIVNSRAEILKELHTFIEDSKNKKFILGYFYKSPATSFELISSPFDETKFGVYWTKRKSRVGIKENPLFQRYLAVKRAEFKASEEFKALKDCEMFASADEIAFCTTFTGGLKETKDEEMEENLILMDKLNKKVLDVYDKNTVSLLTTPTTTKNRATPRITKNTKVTSRTSVDFSEGNENIKAIRTRCDPTVRNNSVTFLGVKLDLKGIASTENKETLERLERMKRVNKYFASEESSVIESVRLFTKAGHSARGAETSLETKVDSENDGFLGGEVKTTPMLSLSGILPTPSSTKKKRTPTFRWLTPETLVSIQDRVKDKTSCVLCDYTTSEKRILFHTRQHFTRHFCSCTFQRASRDSLYDHQCAARKNMESGHGNPDGEIYEVDAASYPDFCKHMGWADPPEFGPCIPNVKENKADSTTH